MNFNNGLITNLLLHEGKKVCVRELERRSKHLLQMSSQSASIRGLFSWFVVYSVDFRTTLNMHMGASCIRELLSLSG